MSHPYRRRALCLVLAAAIVGGIFLYDQQTRLQRETVEFVSAALPRSFDGFRIAVISDLHGRSFGPGNRTLLAKTAALKPDLIAITGDVIDHEGQMDSIPALAAGLAQIAPTYYVTGNHEWATHQVPRLRALLQEHGVTPLSNTFLPLERNGETILVAGVDDPNGPYDQKTIPEVMAQARSAYGDTFTLLLAHRNTPRAYSFGEGDADFTLCGHSHGGLVRYFSPASRQWKGLFGHEKPLFPEFTEGLWATADGSGGYISRGLGNVPPSLRLLNRPHLPLIILKAQ